MAGYVANNRSLSRNLRSTEGSLAPSESFILAVYSRSDPFCTGGGSAIGVRRGRDRIGSGYRCRDGEAYPVPGSTACLGGFRHWTARFTWSSWGHGGVGWRVKGSRVGAGKNLGCRLQFCRQVSASYLTEVHVEECGGN